MKHFHTSTIVKDHNILFISKWYPFKSDLELGWAFKKQTNMEQQFAGKSEPRLNSHLCRRAIFVLCCCTVWKINEYWLIRKWVVRLCIWFAQRELRAPAGQVCPCCDKRFIIIQALGINPLVIRVVMWTGN